MRISFELGFECGGKLGFDAEWIGDLGFDFVGKMRRGLEGNKLKCIAERIHIRFLYFIR